jgi:hypothetical protein
MNIFYRSKCPRKAAESLCDQHVVKMPLETAQILSTAHRYLDGNLVEGRTESGRKAKRWVLDNHDDKFYLAAHVNHPSTVWARQSKEHYEWLYEHFKALSLEFERRFKHNHKSWNKLKFFTSKAPQNIESSGFIDPPQCMPDEFKDPDTVTAYNKYYEFKFFDWLQKGRPMRWTKEVV